MSKLQACATFSPHVERRRFSIRSRKHGSDPRPRGQIATFGSTSFRFYLISELMDQVNEVRVRDGQIHAERPQILTPDHYARLLLERLRREGQRYVDQLRGRAQQFAVLRYGFQFRKTDVVENTVRASLASVIERTKARVESGESRSAPSSKAWMTRGKSACSSSRSI